MSLAIAVVYEAPADFRTATDLADRVLTEAIEWLEPELLEHQRTWVGDHAGRVFTWTGIRQLARENGISAFGHFEGQPGEPDAAAARRAILTLRRLCPDLAGVMLVRDQDNQPEPWAGLEQARNQEVVLSVVIGLAIVERESWVISGFDPSNDPETSRLDAERETLGFDPRHKSHELTACKDDRAKRSPKRVIASLSRGDPDREPRCWCQTPLDVLRERGAENGLAWFLAEVRERIAPLIGDVAG